MARCSARQARSRSTTDLPGYRRCRPRRAISCFTEAEPCEVRCRERRCDAVPFASLAILNCALKAAHFLGRCPARAPSGSMSRNRDVLPFTAFVHKVHTSANGAITSLSERRPARRRLRLSAHGSCAHCAAHTNTDDARAIPARPGTVVCDCVACEYRHGGRCGRAGRLARAARDAGPGRERSRRRRSNVLGLPCSVRAQ